LGIGIITRNRRDCVLEVVRRVRLHTVADYDLVVGVDHSDDDTLTVLADRGVRTVEPVERGIPANRNAVLAALRDHEVIILIEDDHKPVVDSWEQPYVDVVTRTPVKVCLALSAIHGLLTTQEFESGLTVGWRPNMGCVLVAMHRTVLDTVGGWDPAFGDRYGLDDGTWAIRCIRAGLTGPHKGFPCLPGDLGLTTDILDPPSSDGKTVAEREADIEANWPLWENRHNGPILIPLPTSAAGTATSSG
jgi:glycosyltransferase involved in cell wall biosynthesis